MWKFIWILLVCLTGCGDSEVSVTDVLPETEESSVVGLTYLVHDAAGSGDVDGLESLRDDGAALDSLNGKGLTALQVAVESWQVQAVRWLLEQGVDVNGAPSLGKAPLLLGVEIFGETELGTTEWDAAREVLVVLLEHGANPMESYNGYLSAVQRAMDLRCESCVSLLRRGAFSKGAGDVGR